MPAPLTARQRDILKFFRQYVEEQGISPTLEEIAANFGVNKVTIFGHVAELERKGVMKRAARGVSRGLQLVDEDSRTSARRLGGRSNGAAYQSSRPGSHGSGRDEENANSLVPRLAILGSIAAGSPIAAIEEPEDLDLGDLLPRGAEVFALRVQGDSMIEDAIADGDLVLVESRAAANNGETVVAVLPDGSTTLKRFYRDKVGGKAMIRLQPANAAMEPIYLKEVEVRGVVVAVVRRL